MINRNKEHKPDPELKQLVKFGAVLHGINHVGDDLSALKFIIKKINNENMFITRLLVSNLNREITATTKSVVAIQTSITAGLLYFSSTAVVSTATALLGPVAIATVAGYGIYKLFNSENYKDTIRDVDRILNDLEPDDRERSESRLREYAKVKEFKVLADFLNITFRETISKLVSNFDGIRDEKLAIFNQHCLMAVLKPKNYTYIVKAWYGKFDDLIEIEHLGDLREDYDLAIENSKILRLQLFSIIKNGRIHNNQTYTDLDPDCTVKINDFLSKNEQYLNFLKVTAYHMIDYAIKEGNISELRLDNKFRIYATYVVENALQNRPQKSQNDLQVANYI